MDTRSRKRKRGRKPNSAHSNRSETSAATRDASATDICTNQNAANLPECIPAVSQSASKASLVSTSSAPRQYSSCTRLSRGRSPSPARITRQREHSELQRLNSRLSTYADNVRHLQAENARLRLQLETMDDVIKRETGNIKQLHGMEIRSLQELLDKCYEDRTHLESRCEELKADNEVLSISVQDKNSEITSLQEKVEAYKSLSAAFQQLQSEYDSRTTALAETRQDVQRLSAELVKEKRCRRRLEDEAKISKERYLQEVEDASARFSQHLHHADQKLEEGYETMVTAALSSVREQHARDLETLRTELTSTYQSKLTEWKSKYEVAQADLIAMRRDVKVTRQGHDKLRDQVTQFKAEKAALEVQLSETQTRLEELKEVSERDRCQSQREVALLSQELAEVKEELDQVGGANTRLEAEINSYRLIVEDLEGQTPTKTSGTRTSRHRDSVEDPESMESLSMECVSRDRKKRKKDKHSRGKKKGTGTGKSDCFRTNEFSQGIDILEVDAGGRYITLINTTDHPADLALWSIQEMDDAGHKVKYEITKSLQLPRGKRLTVWSSEAGPGVGTDRQAGHEQAVESEGEFIDGLQLTMSDLTWLRLDQHLAVRLEDGDGQLQAKCDVNSFNESPDLKRPRLLPLPKRLPTSGNLSTDSSVVTSSSTSHIADENVGDGATTAVYASSSFACGAAAEVDRARHQNTRTLHDKDHCCLM